MKKRRSMQFNVSLVEILVVVVFLLFVFVGFFRGFLVKNEKAVKALESAGYTNIEIIERDVFFIAFRGGEETDAARFQVNATNPIGKNVKVYVFVGWPFKGATIRGL